MHTSNAGSSSARVLLISPEKQSRRTIAALLREGGFATSCESTVAVATSPLIENRTLANHFDVIIVDEPDTVLDDIGDAPELPELLSNRNIDVPVIAVSVMLSQDKVSEAGYKAVIAKPVCRETLFTVVDGCTR